MQSVIRQLIEPAKTIFTLSMQERVKLEPNDLDNGARLLSSEGNNMIYVLGKGWAVWDGLKFGFRGGKLKAREIAATLRNIVLEEAKAAWDVEIDVATLQNDLENELKKRNPAFTDHDGARRFLCSGKVAKLIRHATKCGNARIFESALKVCEHQVSVDITELNQNPWSFVVPNGGIDLKRVVETKIPRSLTAIWHSTSASYLRLVRISLTVPFCMLKPITITSENTFFHSLHCDEGRSVGYMWKGGNFLTHNVAILDNALRADF